MDRKEELLNIVCRDTDNEKKFCVLVDEVIFLEGELAKLKTMPFIKVHPENPCLQKATPASKLYKELLQQYNNCLKTLFRSTGQDESDEESPLRKWVRDYGLNGE